MRGSEPLHDAMQDDVTVQDLALNERAEKMTGWPQRLHAWLFDKDVFASVSSNEALMRIHGTAEEFEPAAEECFNPFQASSSPVLPRCSIA